MRKLAISMCVFLCLPIIILAQDSDNVATRGTVFGGYSLLHNNNSLGGSFGSGLGSTNFNGWDAQGTFNEKLHRWDKEANDIHTALTGIGHVVYTSGGTYMEGDKKAASYFQ